MKTEADYNHATTRPLLLCLSAHDKATLARNAAALKIAASRYFPADLAFTLNIRRTRYNQRAFTVLREGKEPEAFEETALSYGTIGKNIPAVGYIFTGQGAQWAGMGAIAMSTFPSFLKTICKLDIVLSKLGPKPSFSIEEVLAGRSHAEKFNDAEITQPLCTAIQIAIVDLFAQWGVEPTVTVGHSSGEIAAAYAAGLISAPEAIIAAYYRGFAVTRYAKSGGMLAVGLGAENVSEYFSQSTSDVVIACENSPNSTTLSGPVASLHDIKKRLDAEKIFSRELKTGKAYHSPYMEPVSETYNRLLQESSHKLDTEDRSWHRPRARMVSSVTGSEISGNHLSVSYWSDNLRHRVRFDSAISAMREKADLDEINCMIEIGPHSALSGPFKQICIANGFDRFTYIPTLIRSQNDAAQLLSAAGSLFLQNYPLDLEAVNAVEAEDQASHSYKGINPLLLVDLPPYQWNYDKTYWAEPRGSAEQRNLTHPRHDILGSKVSGLFTSSIVECFELGNAAVFPAAAHMALAIEALRQIHEDQKLPFQSVTLRDIDIKTALVTPETDEGIEIQLSLQQIILASEGVDWYTFSVESVLDGQWTSHCEGKIAADVTTAKTEQDYKSPVQKAKLTQRVPGKRWYDAFSRVGFEYTRSFQQLRSVRTNSKYHDAAAEVQILQCSNLMHGESRYMVHPATVDACLQLIIISINAGLHKQMAHGVVPIKVDEVNYWFPKDTSNTVGRAIAWTDNFEARHYNTHTKLMEKSGNLILDIKNLRCVAYEAAIPPQAVGDRAPEPYMESTWKPDISTLTTLRMNELWHSLSGIQVIGKLVELFDHKYKIENLLLLGRPDKIGLNALLQALPTAIPITVAYIDAEHSGSHEDEESDEADDRVSTIHLTGEMSDWNESLTDPYDLIIISPALSSFTALGNAPEKFKPLIQPGGRLIASGQNSSSDGLAKALSLSAWSVTEIPAANEETVLLCDATPYSNGADHGIQDITILSVDIHSNPNSTIVKAIADYGAQVTVKSVEDFDPLTDQKVVIPDLSGTLLSETSKDTFAALQTVLCAPILILWLTQGVKEGLSSAGGMAEGFLRVIRSEQAAARIVLLDFDTKEDNENVGRAVVSRLDYVAPKDSGADTEFWLHQGVLHVDRVRANQSLNVDNSVLPAVVETQLLPSGAHLSGEIQEGRLHFRPDSPEPAPLAKGYVEIQVKASDLQKTTDTECMVFGQVLRLGTDVDFSLIGKDVVAYAPQAYSTLVQTAVWEPASTRIEPMSLLATIPSLCQAVNAAVRTAKSEIGEQILLLPGPTSIIQAFIRVAHVFNWKLTIVANNERESKMYQHGLGLDARAILLAQEQKSISDFVQGSAAPKVVIAHDFSALSKEVWRLITPMGRFVLNEASIDSPLDAIPFTRGASFLTASVTALNKQDEKAGRGLLKLTLAIFSTHEQRLAANPTVYDVGDVEVTRVKDVQEAVVAYDYGKSSIQVSTTIYTMFLCDVPPLTEPCKVEPTPEVYRFVPQATYLLVGCLGGLGRSLTTWMVERGAKHLAFISRSGADKPEAAEIIKSIQLAGASAMVYRADASNQEEVLRLVKMLTAERPIRGVVHAAMVLKDGIYENMAAEDFSAATIPKVRGAQSLDRALRGIELDFFVMTSSISATLGNPGQSNYSAANSFLDYLAWQRNLRYQAGTSLVLPMVLDVGVVAENEDIEISLARKALYGIDEQEMLRGFEIAMSQPRPKPGQPIKMGDSQIILGLEPTELAKTLALNDSADAFWYNDARFRHIRAAVEDVVESSDSTGEMGNFSNTLKAALTESVDAAIRAISQHTMQRCSSILMVPIESFEYAGPSIASYGLDSMIGAELRSWLFKEFGLDMPFQSLLAPTLSFEGLSVVIAQKMELLPRED
ncbi:MAG: hypothetical protein Q9170_004823 [Blastenia crenularia]